MTKVEKQIRYPNRVPIDNIAALRLIVGKEPNDYVILLGKDRVGNDGREYYWVSDSFGVDDGDWVIKPNVVDPKDGGRWLKVGKTNTADGTFAGVKSTIFGNGSAYAFYIEHPFSTMDVMVEVYKVTTAETVEVNVVRSLGGVTITFKQQPDNEEEFRVLIITF